MESTPGCNRRNDVLVFMSSWRSCVPCSSDQLFPATSDFKCAIGARQSGAANDFGSMTRPEMHCAEKRFDIDAEV